MLVGITSVMFHLVHIWNSFTFAQNTDLHVNDCLSGKSLESYSVNLNNSEIVLNMDVKNRIRPYREPEQVSMKYQYNKSSTITIISYYY